MSKDDFHVIAYRILQYLYECMKAGQDPDANKITAANYEINDRYFNVIIKELYNNGYIDNVYEVNTIGSLYTRYTIKSDITITLKGIEYLTDNTFIEKAKRFFKATKEIVQFI